MITSKDCIKKYGIPYDEGTTTVNENSLFENKYMTLWDVPADINAAIPTIPNKIYCNRDMVGPLEKGLRNVIARGLAHEIKTWDGCFNIRNKRGLSSLSIHSWGGAFDINAAWNGLNKKPTMSKELVQCFIDAGLDWGGFWKRLDGMHFQLAKI
jgi:hypothetical protein